MPIPLFIGLILGGGLSIVAAILGVIALFEGTGPQRHGHRARGASTDSSTPSIPHEI